MEFATEMIIKSANAGAKIKVRLQLHYTKMTEYSIHLIYVR